MTAAAVLVTGATGFIGAHVTRALLARGLCVTALCRDAARGAAWAAELDAPAGRLRVVAGDVTDLASWPGAELDELAGHRTILHLAWGHLGAYRSPAHEEEELPRHLAFLSALVERGAKRLLVAGTCLEYGLVEGALAEDMDTHPVTAYGRAKDRLRRALEPLCAARGAGLCWARLFYMHGPGQSEKSLLSQLDRAINSGAESFDMSGGEQERDYLPVERVAELLAALALQDRVGGVVNVGSGKPVTVRALVEDRLRERGATLRLNLGRYPYPDYEPMRFWADTTKLAAALEADTARGEQAAQGTRVHEKIAEFMRERQERIAAMAGNNPLKDSAQAFTVESTKAGYSYNFSWMGRPIIQYPQDMLALQEIVWEMRPDVIFETGIAHGGSLVYSASLLQLLGGEGFVLGLDIDIREHNREAIDAHPMRGRIRMLQGSSIDEAMAAQVRAELAGCANPLVILDSNHTHEHVLAELRLYSPLVKKGGWLIVFDTVVENMPADFYPDRPWSVGDNPMTAVDAFLAENDRFAIDEAMDAKLCVSMAPRGYLRCVRD